MTKHFYIKFLLLFALLVQLKVDLLAQTSLTPTETVCVGALRSYRVEGNAGSTIHWSVQGGTVYDAGSPVTDEDAVTAGTQYSEAVVAGESAIQILWNVVEGNYTVTAYEETSNSCTSGNLSLSVTVGDSQNPTASNPVAISVQCISDIPTPDVTVVTDEADNCTANPTVAFVSDANNGGAGTTASPYIVTRTYSVTDDSGNSINVIQTITAIDDQAPVIPVLADVTGECSATATAPSTTDNCAGSITGTTSDAITYTTQGTHVITWTFDDGNGNSVTATQNVIVDDVTAPVISDLSDLSIDDCADDETAVPQSKVFSGLAVPVARYSDNCSSSFTVQYRIQLPDLTYANAYGTAATGASVSDPSGYAFPEGTSTVLVRIIDDSGNISNIESYTISVNHKPNPSNINF